MNLFVVRWFSLWVVLLCLMLLNGSLGLLVSMRLMQIMFVLIWLVMCLVWFVFVVNMYDLRLNVVLFVSVIVVFLFVMWYMIVVGLNSFFWQMFMFGVMLVSMVGVKNVFLCVLLVSSVVFCLIVELICFCRFFVVVLEEIGLSIVLLSIGLVVLIVVIVVVNFFMNVLYSLLMMMKCFVLLQV